jgi:hypothetical protein
MVSERAQTGDGPVSGRHEFRRVRRRLLGTVSAAMLAASTLLLVLLPAASPVGAASTGPDWGSVFAWGRDNVHQTDVPSPANGGGITHISAAGHLALALTWDGKVVAWGDNTYGQTNVPASLTDATAIAAGGTFGVALRKTGSVVVWGSSAYHITNIPAAAQSGVVGIAAGASFVLALKSDGSIVAWGNNTNGALTIPQVNGAPLSNLKAVSASGQVIGIKPDGTVAAWGLNDYGQTNVPSYLTGATSVAAGLRFSLALDANGSVIGWGDNTSGELTAPCRLYNIATKTCVQPYSGFSAIAAGDKHTVAVRGGVLYAWGDNTYGQTTIPDTRPNGPDGFVEVAAGSDFSIALWRRPTAPAPPVEVGASAGAASASLWWAGMGARGAAITSCMITAYPGGKTAVVPEVIDAGGWSHGTITGLTNGTTYTFTIRAINGIGTGDESVHSNAVTPQGQGLAVSLAPPIFSFNLKPSLSLSSIKPISLSTSAPTGAPAATAATAPSGTLPSAESSEGIAVAKPTEAASPGGPMAPVGSPAFSSGVAPASGASPSGGTGSGGGGSGGGGGGVPLIVLIAAGAVVGGGAAAGLYFWRRSP